MKYKKVRNGGRVLSSILITNNDIIDKEFSYQIPWIYEANAHNMIRNAPQKTINISKYGWKEKLKREIKDIEALFIITDLEEKDYDIISEMIGLESLYIFTAQKMKNICFIENLLELKNLMICHSQISDLSPIRKLRIKQDEINKPSFLQLLCLALIDSKIADLSSLGDMDFFSEFVVVDNFVPKNDSIYLNIMNKTYYFWKRK